MGGADMSLLFLPSMSSLTSMSSGSLVGFLVAMSFAAGLNVYATTTTLGVLAKLHWVALPVGLAPLANSWVLAAGAVLFLCEVFADKIPYVDLVWNLAHTFIRVPIAGLLAYRAAATLSPTAQLAAAALGALIASVAHGSKTAARTLVTASPEPFSNIALSASEDVAAVSLTWLATQHPVLAAVVASLAVVAAIAFGRWLVRGFRRQLSGLRGRRLRSGAAPMLER